MATLLQQHVTHGYTIFSYSLATEAKQLGVNIMGICAVSHDLRCYEAEQDRLENLAIQEEELAKELEETLLGDRIGDVIAEIMSDNSDGLVKGLEILHKAVTPAAKIEAAEFMQEQLKSVASMMAKEEANDKINN